MKFHQNLDNSVAIPHVTKSSHVWRRKKPEQPGVTSETSNGTNTRNQNETVVDRGQSWWVEERTGNQLGDHKALNLGLEVFIFTEEHIWLLPLTLGL